MWKRLIFLLFGIYGIVDTESKPLIKSVIVRVRSRPTATGIEDLAKSIQARLPDGWVAIISMENW